MNSSVLCVTGQSIKQSFGLHISCIYSVFSLHGQVLHWDFSNTSLRFYYCWQAITLQLPFKDRQEKLQEKLLEKLQTKKSVSYVQLA